MDGVGEDSAQVAHFDLGSRRPSGGMTEMPEVMSTKGQGGVVLYFMVDVLELTAKVQSLFAQC